MSISKYSRRRYLISMVLFCHLLALVIPMSTVSAATSDASCNGAIVQTTADAKVVPAADQQVVIPNEVVNAAIFDVYWHEKYKDAKSVEQLVYDMFFLYANVEGNGDVMERFRTSTESALNAQTVSAMPYDGIIHTMLDVALGMPELTPALPQIWKEIADPANYPINLPAQSSAIAQSAKRYGLGERLMSRSSEIFQKIYACAQSNPDVAEAFDEFHSDTFNVSILDSARSVLAQIPNLPIPSDIKDPLLEDDPIILSLDKLAEMGGTEFDILHSTMDDIQETLIEIDKQQSVIIDYIEDQELKQKLQALAKKKADANELKLNAVKASITIIGTIAKEFDPKFANEFTVVANSTLAVGTALNGWLKAVSGFKTLNKIFSLSSIVMTGNVLTAVMNVVALFGDSKPSPEQQILEEIGKLRQQVDQLRKEMHTRFDRIDTELNTIYTTMNQRFNQIDLQLGKINGNVLEVQQSLVTLDLKLSRIERNNFEFLNAIGRRPLLDAINGGLGYQERTGLPMPYQPDFVAFENVLHGWGTIHAFDAANAGPTTRDFSDGQILDELGAYPLDSNINYLNGWLSATGLPPLSTERLASPRDWLFASRAYTQLGIEWPQHMSEVDVQRQATLDEIGDELEAAMDRISTVETPNGPIGNTLLYSTVITLYQGKLHLMDSAIQKLEDDFLKEVKDVRLQRADPFNLYGGIEQSLSYETPELTNATCANPDEHGSFPTTNNLRSLFPNFERYNLADYLKIGTISVCVHNELVGQHDVCTSAAGSQPEFCIRYGRNKAILELFFDNVVILSQSITDEQEQLASQWRADMALNWTVGKNYKAQFEATSSVDLATPTLEAQRAELLNATTNKLIGKLVGYQQELYSSVYNEVSQGSLRPLAIALAGSKALLESFVILGLPRAVAEDEFLHAMLFGDQQLIDDSAIMETYDISATATITNFNLFVNPRPGLKQLADARTLVFSNLLREYLDAISAQAYSEAADYIASTRRDLDLTVRIARIELPPDPPTGDDEIYLPMIHP